MFSDNISDKVNCLEKIRTLESNKNITMDDVFIFSTEIAHNDIDRDNEYFSDDTSEIMATQCVGHYASLPSSSTKIRIFDAKVKSLDKKTFDFRPYKSLVAFCYILKTDANKKMTDWISKNPDCLDASVSCSISSKTPQDNGAVEISNADEFIDFAFMYIPSFNEFEIQYDYENNEDDIKPKKKIKKKDLKERIEKLEERIEKLEEIVEELNYRSTHF